MSFLPSSCTPDPGAHAVVPEQDELEDLIYLISHDLRASLRALLEVPQWIEEDIYEMGHSVPATLSENISMMNVHTKRLDRMLCDLLIFSRVGRMQRKSVIDLNVVCDALIETFAIPLGFEVERDFAWDSFRFGERDIVTLLQALIGNSFKHHDRKSGRILIQTLWEDGEAVMLISDDGPGVDQKFGEIIFDIMQTLRPREEVEGSGMGLAIARKVMKVYSGTLCLSDPILDRGTTFRATFDDVRLAKV